MRIKRKISQSRRDFTAVYICDHCSHEHEDRGYDDAYFHGTVIPETPCPECGETGSPVRSAPDVPGWVTL